MGRGAAAAHPLNEGTLGRHARRIAVPTYDRWSVTPSVVHFGVGAFHRSHQAVYFDDLAQRRVSLEWGLVGVGLHSREMREALSAQDGLYTVVERGAEGTRARVIGAIGNYLFGPDNPAAVVAALAHPRTRLVTLTVTAGGYAAVEEDLERPRSAIGYLVEALARRCHDGLPPFTVLSCDNLSGNGEAARSGILDLARRRDPGLAEWIESCGAFPSSMVDRITPRTTDADREALARDFGVTDVWPVMTEPFSHWIVEDRFCNGRPPLDRVGVRFVDDVRPYSLMKTRMLNASHCAIGFAGSLAGYRTIDEAAADPALAGLIERMMAEDVAPLLGDVPGIDLDEYRGVLMERFANRAIADQLSRLCRNGTGKMQTHVLSSIREARSLGRPHPRLTLAVAAWLRYLRTQGEPAPDRSVFGALARDAGFARELGEALLAIDERGIRAAAAGAVGEPIPA